MTIITYFANYSGQKFHDNDDLFCWQQSLIPWQILLIFLPVIINSIKIITYFSGSIPQP